uniref:Uncharacterized protein n=1 Tax=Streptomyces violaceoruber TaxID=1935 RepID=Q849N6_STRVN|nr:hypothetical protein [Streptomyces violaceoruber]
MQRGPGPQMPGVFCCLATTSEGHFSQYGSASFHGLSPGGWAGLTALKQWVEREGAGRPVPRGHTEEITVVSEAEPVVLKLGVWISNTKPGGAGLPRNSWTHCGARHGLGMIRGHYGASGAPRRPARRGPQTWHPARAASAGMIRAVRTVDERSYGALLCVCRR